MLKPCSEPGCPTLVEKGRCATHRQQAERQDRQRRGSAAKRGYGLKWQAYTKAYKARHPYCRPCEQKGRKTPTWGVDHREPVTGPSDPLFWDPENHQPICKPCHNAKTAGEGLTAQASTREEKVAWDFA